jgi:hypothetical protein
MGEGEYASNRGSRSKGGRNYTEAEILADHSIWDLSDSDEGESRSELGSKSRTDSRMTGKASAAGKSDGRKTKKAAPASKWTKAYDQKERNKNWYDDPDEVRREEVEMARFLIEQAPSVEGQT